MVHQDSSMNASLTVRCRSLELKDRLRKKNSSVWPKFWLKAVMICYSFKITIVVKKGRKWWSSLEKLTTLLTLIYLIEGCLWGLDHLEELWTIFVLRTETLSPPSARINNRKQLIQLGPSLSRLHQIKMRTLLLLLLFCHVSSAGKIIF